MKTEKRWFWFIFIYLVRPKASTITSNNNTYIAKFKISTDPKNATEIPEFKWEIIENDGCISATSEKGAYKLNKIGKAKIKITNMSDPTKYDILRLKVTDDNTITFPVEKCSKEITIHIGAVTYKKPFFNCSEAQAIIFPLSSFKTLYGDSEDETLNRFEFCIKSDDVYAGYEALKTSLKDNGLSLDGLYNYADEAESNRSMILIIKVFAYGFIILISLIAAANVFNTITTNINLRRREFAMLRSVGMTSKGMKKMLNFECIMYGTKALLYGLPVSAVVTYLIYLSVDQGLDTEFFIPWTAVIVAVLSVFVVVFSTMMFSMIKIRKDNTIDALKNENL